MVDVRVMAERAPIVFRGEVVNVESTAEKPSDPRVEGIATFQVDRAYRDHVPDLLRLHFVYDPVFSSGHNCINFRPNTYWIVFAQQVTDHLELTDDCDGALPVSPLLGPTINDGKWLKQMEADFIAGLNDEDPILRLASVQRLGGLGLRSSRDALDGVLATGDKVESTWALYALLRTGDVTILPKIEQMLRFGVNAPAQRAIALQLQNVAEESAVPELIAILKSAPDALTRSSVLIALGEKLKDPQAIPSLADHLSDPDRYARYDALDGLRNLTHENACTLPPNWREQDVEPQILKCRTWWQQQGRFLSWTDR